MYIALPSWIGTRTKINKMCQTTVAGVCMHIEIYEELGMDVVALFSIPASVIFSQTLQRSWRCWYDGTWPPSRNPVGIGRKVSWIALLNLPMWAYGNYLV